MTVPRIRLSARTAAVLAASCLMLAACGSASTGTGSTEPSAAASAASSTPQDASAAPVPAASAAPAPSSPAVPAELTVAEASVRYLQAVCPANELIRRANKAAGSWDGSNSAMSKANVAFFTRGAEVSRRGAALLDDPATVWPANVRKGVSQVVVAMLQDVSTYTQAAQAKTKGEASDEVYDTRKKLDNSQAQLVRLRLGLPAADADDDGCGPYRTPAS